MAPIAFVERQNLPVQRPQRDGRANKHSDPVSVPQFDSGDKIKPKTGPIHQGARKEKTAPHVRRDLPERFDTWPD